MFHQGTHEHVTGAVCGGWWTGPICADGTPNGYAVATFEGHDYALRYKAARRPADYQMNIDAPDRVRAGSAAEREILVNVFAGSERSRVELRLTGSPRSAGTTRSVTRK